MMSEDTKPSSIESETGSNGEVSDNEIEARNSSSQDKKEDLQSDISMVTGSGEQVTLLEGSESNLKASGSQNETGMNWYSVYVQAGCESRVIEALRHRISKSPLSSKFGEILLPKVAEGGDESKAKKIMPGYIFIQMSMTDDTWELVRTTPKVLGFIGGYKNPPPIPEEEIQRLKDIVESKGEVLKERIKFSEGDVVTINEGPFKDFIGKVIQIDDERSKLTVEITIFGRQTPVQVDFSQVTRR